MTKIYLVQHGEALAGEIDERRPLSDIGRKNTEAVAHCLQKPANNLSSIYHSGKQRARETAEIFARIMPVSIVEEMAGLKPNDDINILVSQLDALETSAAMYVGHLPHLSRAASFLVAGNDRAEVIRFKNSGVICLEKEQGWHISWIITPEICPA